MGGDQVFARAGTLKAVIPAAGYREKPPEGSHTGYDNLFGRAAVLHRLPFTESTRDLAAGVRGTSAPRPVPVIGTRISQVFRTTVS